MILTLKKVDTYISTYSFHEIANELYHFVWHQYCDWYIELSKSALQSNNEYSNETKKVAIFTFVEILKIIHPIMPFISEELWSKFVHKDQLLINEKFNHYNNIHLFDKSQKNIQHLIQIISSIRNLRSEINIPYKTLIDIEITNSDHELINFFKDYENELKKILKLGKISFKSTIKNISNCAYIVILKTTILVHLKDIIDTNKELERIEQKKVKLLDKLKGVEIKLSNSNFTKKAPQEVIENFKNEATDLKSSIEKIDQIINTIK